MQRVLFQQQDLDQLQSQASHTLPGHGTAVQAPAVNDDSYRDGDSPLWLVCSVLGNVVGGLLLLSMLFFLPHFVAGILG